MDAEIAAFLSRQTALGETTVVWGGGSLRLRITAYLAEELPPLDALTSVRGLVFRDELILVLRDQDGFHLLPGGRREPGESLEATLEREVLEETGWRVTPVGILGFLHFRHLGPKPPDYRYPYPDFFQAVYLAEAVDLESDPDRVGDYALEVAFLSPAEAHALDLPESNRFLLDAALTARANLHA